MQVKQIPVGPMHNLSYLIVCAETREAALVDPAWEEDTLDRAIQDSGSAPPAPQVPAAPPPAGAAIRLLLCTHGHDDHVNLVPKFLEKYPKAVAVCHERERLSAPKDRTRKVTNGEEIALGKLSIRCMHTPGHTPGSVTYIVDDHAFFGDTLFSGEDCGRVDLYRDGPADMAASLQKIRTLPDHLIVCSGHKYGAHDTTTLKFEKDHNRALKCRTLEEFLGFKG